MPVRLIRVSVYQDGDGRRIVDIEGDHEPDLHTSPGSSATKASYQLKVADLVAEGPLQAGDSLTWTRPRKGEEHHATITSDGQIQLSDGSTYWSPSGAACAAADIPAYDGWLAWSVDRLGRSLHAIRSDHLGAGGG